MLTKEKILSGAGNSFIFIPCPDLPLSKSNISTQCKNHHVDGLIYLSPSEQADYYMNYFNCDGSSADLCGNGLRATSCYLDLLENRKEATVQTPSGIYSLYKTSDGQYAVSYPPVQAPLQGVQLDEYSCYFLHVGIPHIVLFVDALPSYPVFTIGRQLRFHPTLAPAGANINFVQVIDNNLLHIRTYERGVEEETLACGSGCLSAYLTALHLKKISSPCQIRVQSNAILSHKMQSNGHILQAGPVTELSPTH